MAERHPPVETGYFEPYKAFATTLRTWLVGYGIGAPVLFASQNAFANLLKKPETAVVIITVFLGGVVAQVLAAVVFKVCMWYLYCADFNADFRQTRRYKLSYLLSDNIWLELFFDAVSIGAFSWATFRVLTEFASQAAAAAP